MGWTDERVEQLKQLWQDGLSASQIARQLGGVTRNAVIGKVHRLGLAGRATSARAERPRVQMPRRTPVIRPALVAPALPVVERDPLMDEHGNHATVLTISDRMCKWPIGDPATTNFHFCGHKPKDGSPYCEAHCVKAFQPTQSRRDRDRDYRRYLANG
ncbi:MAG TPA: GcrA cell cycle regulator [Alphaproteobacteria bacterium]|nr:GcrA cell cycle regulator [Alphaproteobacteria bacterium]HAJ48023.1 GcrA cell cycle regulator [Alphaproteobacteria bacterium]